jgi:hypothetical protein
MRADAGAYDPRILEALVSCHEDGETEAPPRDIDVLDLEEGMVVFDDVLTMEGVLLIGRGAVVSESLIRRLGAELRVGVGSGSSEALIAMIQAIKRNSDVRGCRRNRLRSGDQGNRCRSRTSIDSRKLSV